MDDPRFDWDNFKPSDYLTSEEMDEIGAAHHLYSYPAITAIRRRVRENYSTKEGAHYAGAEEDAAKLLEIVDALYAQRERTKAAINEQLRHLETIIEQDRQSQIEDKVFLAKTLHGDESYRDGLVRALKHMTDTSLEAF